MPLSNIFLNRLSLKMKAKNINQVLLAEKVHVGSSTVNGWFKGRGFPSLDKIGEIAEVLEVPPFWLFGGPDKDEDQALVRTIADIRQEVMKAVDPKLEELVEVAGRLSDENLDVVIKAARVFAGETAAEVLGKDSEKEKA